MTNPFRNPHAAHRPNRAAMPPLGYGCALLAVALFPLAWLAGMLFEKYLRQSEGWRALQKSRWFRLD